MFLFPQAQNVLPIYLIMVGSSCSLMRCVFLSLPKTFTLSSNIYTRFQSHHKVNGLFQSVQWPYSLEKSGSHTVLLLCIAIKVLAGIKIFNFSDLFHISWLKELVLQPPSSFVLAFPDPTPTRLLIFAFHGNV